MNKQMMYLVGMVASFFVLMLILGYLETSGGGDETRNMNPDLLKQELYQQIEREYGTSPEKNE